MGRAIGIDLGTTYCAVAVLDADGTPKILPNRDGEDITPSVVLFQDFGSGDEPLVGTLAKQAAPDAPLDVVQYVKRQMGDPTWRFVSSSGAHYTAEEVSAIILRRLRDDAELALGEPVSDAVITVPAYFDDARRTATRQAGAIAGLNVLRVLNEPTAAALSFGVDTAGQGNVLVYDLGGGTFDVTIMRITDGTFDVLATDGDRQLGGFDFDNRLMQFVADEIVGQGGPDLLDTPEDLANLREKIEHAKRALTTVPQTNVSITAGGRPYRVVVKRTDFELLTSDLLGRTRDLAQHVLDEAGIAWTDLDHVLLVGGSTRMPMIAQLVEGLTGRPVSRDSRPDESVALGAAVQAAIEQRDAPASSQPEIVAGIALPTVEDVTSQALGVLTVDPSDPSRKRNSVVIPRNAKIPARFSSEVRTVSDGQTRVSVTVTQGDDPDPQFAVEIGVRELPVPAYPAGAPLRLTYAYDVDQTVSVELEDLTAGRPLGTFEIERVANLDGEAVRAATERVAGLSLQ
ncbi:Hsp70 family protein [Pseudoclavibacter chungangensis]|uniref:Hsp70 family protein n=1 Tax=Pseudoclavibacter chungangensis TaxID=587635 RepID=A0A7J5C042_9MICO|nr:Hsp70 family protein [Pseudoclavibacter chungangensis]KAB1660250.1 Hsp70 family protein [Pseudoclavibacter chungangensis]NYJ65591.1 molecular chaperone DnaK [Pseudoclavibacter chungangensis]